MISPALTKLGENLLQAASRRRYDDVSRLAVKAGTAAAEEAGALAAGDPGIREIAAWLADLFGRAETLVRIARASQAAELRRVTFLQRYLPGDRRVDRRFAISG